MAVTAQYDLGYAEFKVNKEHTPEYTKQMPPLWRAGYRKAQQDHAKMNQVSLPMELWDVQRKTTVYKPTWNDIMAATRRPRFNKLHQDHMQPLLNMLINAVEKNQDSITSFGQVRVEVDKAFDIILQYGYDTGVLTTKDLKKYDYEPK